MASASSVLTSGMDGEVGSGGGNLEPLFSYRESWGCFCRSFLGFLVAIAALIKVYASNKVLTNSIINYHT